MWLCRQTANIYVKTEHFTIGVKDNDTTKTANIKIVLLQSWHIFTRTRTIAMFYLKCKIVRTCDFVYYLTTINLGTFHKSRCKKYIVYLCKKLNILQ